jgi:flagellar biosynthesis/type III secretory pathway chaperone
MNLRWVTTIMENKKSLFEKLGLVEKVQTTPEEEADLSISEESNESFVNRINATVEKTNPFVTEILEKPNTFKFDRHNEVSEVYNIYNLKLDGINTIFIIENFLKALPEYLPEDVKRQSLFDIIASSGMNMETLITDGSERLKSLNAFFEQFSTNTNKNIQEREKEIEILVKKINQCKTEIQGFEQLKDAQKATIDYEVQKVSNILRFVNPSKQL